MKTNSLSWSRWAGLLAVTAAATLYFFTLDNGLRPEELVGGDLITHQYAQVEARPSNAPGYPLYTMGGWLWFRFGRMTFSWTLNPIEILSAYSALWGLASLAILYLILRDITGNRPFIAALLTVFHATTFFFWYYSVTTEQYTSAVFQTLLLIWLAFRWDRRPRHTTLLGMAFVSGTMAANMVTTLFILPPLLWFIFVRTEDGRWMLASYLKRPTLVAQALGAGLLPLLSYAYIYIRGAQHPEWRGEGSWPTTWAWFVDFLTIQQGRDELAPGLTLQTIFTAEFPALMWGELTWPIFLGGLVGLAFLGRRRAIFLYATLAIYLFFCWGYRFGNWFQVIIPAYPIFTLGFAALLHQLLTQVEQRSHRSAAIQSSYLPLLARTFLLLLLGGLLLFRLTTNLPRANQQDRPTDTGLDPGWAILADRPTAPAHIAANFEERVALEYLTIVWTAATGLTPIEAGQIGLPNLAGKHNLYLTRQASAQALAAAPDALARLHPQAAGAQLIALHPAPQTELPATAIPIDLDFGPAIQLTGWELQTGNPAEELTAISGHSLALANWRLVLYWRSNQSLDTDYTVSIRPLVNGQLLFVGETPLIQDHQPIWGLAPTSRWRSGQIIRDVYALRLPADISPTAVQIVLYRPTDSGFENLAEHTLDLASQSP